MKQIQLNISVNRPNQNHLILDIGGTLSKLCVLKVKDKKSSILLSSISSDSFERIVETIKSDFMMTLNEFDKITVTGGGSIKFSKELHNVFGGFSVEDEIESVVKGALFVLEQFKTEDIANLKYPMILANVGTGASFILIEENKRYKRIGGTNVAGGTFSGILNLSGQIKNIANISTFIESGDKNKVDVLVRDIYGSSYSNIGLNGDIVAGSLAKVKFYSGQNFLADVSASSAFMVCSNLVHLLYLYSTIHGALSILFGGSFSTMPAISQLLKNITTSMLPSNFETKILDFGGFLGCFGIASKLLLE